MYKILQKLTLVLLHCDGFIIITGESASPDGWAVWSAVVFTRWWLLVDHCVLRNWDRILVRAVKGLISRAGMVSICPLLWQRDVKLQQTKPLQEKAEIVAIDEMAVSNIVFKTLADSNNRCYAHLITSEARHNCPISWLQLQYFLHRDKV